MTLVIFAVKKFRRRNKILFVKMNLCLFDLIIEFKLKNYKFSFKLLWKNNQLDLKFA
jgi:hypothetical protein